MQSQIKGGILILFWIAYTARAHALRRWLSHRLDRITRNFFQVHHFFTILLVLFSALRNLAEVRSFACIANWIPIRCEWTNLFRKLSSCMQAFAVVLSTLQSWQRWRFLGDFACSIAMQAIYIHFFTFAFCGSLRTFVHSLLNWIPMRMNDRTSDRSNMRTFPAAHDFAFDFVPNKVVDSYTHTVEPMTRSHVHSIIHT